MRLTGLLFILLLVPAGLHARQDDPRLSARLGPEAATRVSRLVAAAREAGLPTEPLVDKALEGASKRASAARIAAAVERLAGDLTLARDAIGPGAAAGELVSGAAALRAGATPADLAAVRAARRQGALTVPLATLADLLERGVPVETASSVIVGLTARGSADAGFVALRRAVDRDIRAGVPPGASATVRGQGKGPPEGVVAPGRSGDRPRPGRGNSAG